MKELTLRSKIVAVGGFLLIFPVLIFGIIIYLRSSTILNEIAKRQFVQIAKSMSAMVELSLEKELRIINSLATDPVIIHEALTGKKVKTRQKLADLYVRMSGDYEGIAAYNKSGVIYADAIDLNREGISIAERNYFEMAKLGKKEIGPVVLSKATGKPIFVFSAPIISPKGKFLGGIIGVVKAGALMSYVDSMKVGHTGYAFLLDHNGVIIAHPTEPLYKNFREKKLTAFIMTSKDGAVEYTYNNIKKIAGLVPIAISGWTMGVTQNKDETMVLAYTNAKYIVLFGIIFMSLGIIFLMYFSKQISIPVQTRLMRLNQAVEQADEAFIILDTNNNLQFFNSEITKFMENEPKIGDPFLLKEMDQAKLINILSEVREGKVWNGRVQGDRNDGTPYTLELSIAPVLEKSGNLNSYLVIGRDITSKLQLQQQVFQSQKMEAIGILAGGIAHDFNNILSAIFGYTELALLSLNEKEDLESYLKEINNASIRAKDLVDHILAFSRKKEEEFKPLVLKYIIKDTLKLVRASLPSTIVIQDDLQSSAPVLGDTLRIHQIIMNLCTNAGYAMEEHGGFLRLVLQEINGSILKKKYPDATEKSYLCLNISDTGVGMSPEILDKIFDPFFTTKPTGKGTGLGLSVVHGVIKSLQGFISVTSEVGKGTTFTLYLPVIEMEVETEEEIVNKNYPRGNEHIILVDDEVTLTESGRERLERLGYRVSAFERSEEALKIFSQAPEKYDLILTDYTMPNLTGLDLAKGVHSIRKDVPIIICSGYAEVSKEIAGMSNVFFLKKPIMTRDLSKILREVLDNNR